MSWDDWRHFLAVAREGALTGAGRVLGVDHVTVGRRIRALEAALGRVLFDRSPQGYALTEAGHRLVERAEAMERAVLGAEEEAGGPLSGTVRIGAPEGAATALLAPAAVAIGRAHPGLDIQIVVQPRPFSLARREADIAITVSAPDSGRLVVRRIADYTLHAYATRAFLAAHPPIRSLDDLLARPGIGYVPEFIYDRELDYLPLVSPQARARLTSTSVNVQMAAVLAGGGISILHDFMAAQHAELVPVLPEAIGFTRSFFAVMHEDQVRLARVRAVTDGVVEEMRARLSGRVPLRPQAEASHG